VKKLGHSLKRDGLSPIPTAHRDGLGTAPRPPFCLGLFTPRDLHQSDMGLSRIGTGFCDVARNRSYRQNDVWYPLIWTQKTAKSSLRNFS